MKDLRERILKLKNEVFLTFLRGGDFGPLLESFAREIRNEALEEVLRCLDREDFYYKFLDERGETRDARYCTSTVRDYIGALKNTTALAANGEGVAND